MKRSPLDESGNSQFSAMFRDLKSDDSGRQIMALTELSEYLSFSSEEALVSFPMESFIPVLVGLLENPGHGDEAAAQVMLLCCRCLHNLVDILPPTARIISAAGGLPVLCQCLLNVEYIDVAELAVAIIEWISEDQPLQVLKAGGLQAILTFLDFFQISVQRQAANAAAMMLLPVPTPEVLEQHIRPVLPTLAALLQHSDPQVLKSVCECWRRVMDNTIAVLKRPKYVDAPPAMPASAPRSVAKGKWRPIERTGRRDGRDEADPAPSSGAAGPSSAASGGKCAAASASAAASPAPQLAAALEEMCPSGVLSNLLVLLGTAAGAGPGGAAASAGPASGSIASAEVLYILATLTNYSESLTEDVLNQDICALLRQILAADLANAGASMLQPSSSVLRVLATVASMLPAISLTDSGCECEEKRAALFREKPQYLDLLAEAFAPQLLDLYDASVDPYVQSLCVTLLLAFLIASRERPELVERSFDPTQLACFLANLLLSCTSRSQTLACLLVTCELLERHATPYSLLFVRHGAVHAIHRHATTGGDGARGQALEKLAGGAASAAQGPCASAAGVCWRRGSDAKAKLTAELAHRVLSVYFASSSHTGGSPTLRSLGKIAKQLRSSPTEVIGAHREALTTLRELLVSPDSVTAFELMCSGAASALHAFLFPTQGSDIGSASPAPEWRIACGDRLQLFIECITAGGGGACGGALGGALGKLVKLSVSALQRLERQPLKLFPTSTSVASSLPPHLRCTQPALFAPGRGAAAAAAEALGLGGRSGGLADWQSVSGSRRGGHDAGLGTSTLLSVLRLLAKPVRVRMAPYGAAVPRSTGGDDDLHHFRAMLMPFGGKGPHGAGSGAGAGSPPQASRSAASGLSSVLSPEAPGSSSASPAAAAASTAARLRNYLASKVSRKRTTPYTGPGSSGASPADKRSIGPTTGLLSGRSSASGSGAGADAWPPRLPSFEDPWIAAGARCDDEDDHGDHHHIGGGRDGRDRDRDAFGEALEAVLLVEPFASVSALEDYIWEKHGPKQGHGSSSSASGQGRWSGGGRDENIPWHKAALMAAAAAAEDRNASGSGGPRPRGAASSAAGETPAPRMRLSSKQPPALRSTSAESTPPTAGQPPTPLALVDPGTPSGTAGEGGSAASGAAASASPSGAAGSEAAPRRRRRVRIFLNGRLLPSKMSVVQSLVANVGQAAVGGGPRVGGAMPAASSAAGSGGASASSAGPERSGAKERFLVSTEEGGSGSDGEGYIAGGGTLSGGGGGGVHSSPRHFCGAIWGRIHSMTYEFVPEGAPDEVDDEPDAREADAKGFSIAAALPSFAASDFDALAQRHARILGSLAPLSQKSGSDDACAAAVDLPEASSHARADLDSKFAAASASAAGDEEGDDASASAAVGFMAGLRPDQEALPTMLQLISAFHNICQHLRYSEAETPVPEPELFHCGALTAALLRQLSDPLAVCTGSVPSWCTRMAGSCGFLFPCSVRRILHHSCNLGLSRALHHVQQRALAQHAPSQEAQRRLEAEVAVASIPRQKVRISRQRIMESAVKVMNLYGSGGAILEVEYVGEVGTGSGPTLEFFAQVADVLRTSEPRLFRDGVPGGMLFPAPHDPVWLAKAEEQDAQLILERFRLLGQVIAKCILDSRLVDIQLHPLFWRAALKTAPFTHRCLRDVDPELHASMARLRQMDKEALASLCVDFTLPGCPHIALIPGGADISLTGDNLDDYMQRVTEATMVTAIAPQVQAFCSAFKELLPLEACAIWSEMELSSIVAGASVRDPAFWTVEHLAAHVKAQHGYTSDSRCFRNLLELMSGFCPEDRKRFLTFATGAPSLPVGGFGGLKPPLTVVKKEAPPAPLTPDQFMPSVMTCANYLKMPEYSSAEILRQKLTFAMSEGQSAFLLS